MSLVKFVGWFLGSLIIVTGLAEVIGNSFVLGMLVAIVIAILASKD